MAKGTSPISSQRSDELFPASPLADPKKRAALSAAAKRNKFIDYVLGFYGEGGVYNMHATREQVTQAVDHYIAWMGDKCEGDSVDRERVRDMLIQKFDLDFPTN